MTSEKLYFTLTLGTLLCMTINHHYKGSYKLLYLYPKINLCGILSTKEKSLSSTLEEMTILSKLLILERKDNVSIFEIRCK